jgi:pyridoxamine 5'-phosphate oxidase
MEFLDGMSPIEKLQCWFEEAKKTSLQNPNAFALGTVDATSAPHARVVLMKDIRPEGIVFYTNYESQKGRDLAANPNCSALFFWDPLNRQIKLLCKAEKVSRADSEKYWSTRPRLSQLSQWVSKQSRPVPDRETMERELERAKAEFEGRDVPCPGHWGGYILKPTYVEFWIGREGRFHDRYTYRKVESKWLPTRLYP